MQGRKTENYVHVLAKAADILKLQPTVAILDFEKAAQKALKIVFPDIKLTGCFFHYSQVMKRILTCIKIKNYQPLYLSL